MRKLFITIILLCACFNLEANNQYKIEDKEILKRIIHKAEQDWPDNFRMQQCRIESEIEQYCLVKKLKDENNIK